MSKKAKSETFGARLKRVREARGLSQPALAELAGLSVGAIRQFEQELRAPLLATADRLAEALGITTGQLSGREPLPES